jgi:predicted peptidase
LYASVPCGSNEEKEMMFKWTKKLYGKKNIFPFACFWFISTILICGRLCYDLKTYFFGSTLIYRFVSKSGYDYLLQLPKGYTDFGGSRPLLIYLHGAGETGKDVTILEKHGMIRYTKDVADFPFIVISPMTPRHGWEPRQVVCLLDELLADNGKRWNLDRSRIYLTGMSMGGFGTFRTASEFPERFTAIVPVAGGGEPEKAEQLKDVPTWAFHGNADDVVPYECSSKMIEAMQKIGNQDAKLTTFVGAGHGIIHEVYSKPEIYQWLLKRRK